MPILSVRDVSFTYLDAPAPALADLKLEIEPGTVTGIVGPNGAGKTTLCYALAGFIPHFFKGTLRGSIQVDGLDTAKTPLADLVTHVGLAFQNPFNQISGAKLTVAEEIAFGLENLGVPRAEMQARVERALDLFGLRAAAAQSPFALSGGQQQRLALASIFVMETPLLVLDEPTAQLDPQGTRQVMETIGALAAQGRTMVLVEHKLEWIARLASRVLVLDKGRLVADGEPRAVLAHADEWKLNETRYARVAQLAEQRGFRSTQPYPPQTLEQAQEYWRSTELPASADQVRGAS